MSSDFEGTDSRTGRTGSAAPVIVLLLVVIVVLIVGFAANYNKAEQTRQEEQDARWGQTVNKLQEDHSKCVAQQQRAQQDPAHNPPYNPKACG